MRAMSNNTQPTSPGNRGTFESTVREMWTTRPVRFPRSQSQRTWFFGVCEGIAVRYQVSPVLIRLLFVLLAFTGGVGVWVYGAAILLFRRYSVPKTPLEVLLRNERDPRYREDRSIATGTLIVGVIFLLLGGVFSGGITLTGLLLSVGVTGLIWWLLHERTPVAPAGLLDRDDISGSTAPGFVTEAPAAPFEQDEPTVNLDEFSTASGFELPRRQPPSWDPLGTAPFAWDLPDPGQPEDSEHTGATEAPKKKRRGLKALLIGVILAIVLAITGFFGVVFSSWGGFSSTENGDYQGTFVSGTRAVPDLDGNRSYDYTLSSHVLDFADTDVSGDSTIDISSTMSSVVLDFPERTDGDSYAVNINCTDESLSEIDCETMNDTVVTSSGGDEDSDNEPRHTLTVNVKATMSDVRFEQFA